MRITRCYWRLAYKTRSHCSRCKPYWSYKEELSMINDILFQGERLIIPASMRKKVLKLLYQANIGIERTKWRAKAKIFWSHINQQVDEIVETYSTCIHSQRKQSWEPIMSSDMPDYPFQIVGRDLFYWNGQYFVRVVNYYSRYWEIEKLYKTDAATTIRKIRNVVSRLEIPEIIRSDNDPQYNSGEFKRFTKDWGF